MTHRRRHRRRHRHRHRHPHQQTLIGGAVQEELTEAHYLPAVRGIRGRLMKNHAKRTGSQSIRFLVSRYREGAWLCRRGHGYVTAQVPSVSGVHHPCVHCQLSRQDEGNVAQPKVQCMRHGAVSIHNPDPDRPLILTLILALPEPLPSVGLSIALSA